MNINGVPVSILAVFSYMQTFSQVSLLLVSEGLERLLMSFGYWFQFPKSFLLLGI